MVRPLQMPGLGTLAGDSRDQYYFETVEAITPEQLGKWTNRDLNNLVGTRVKLNQPWDILGPQMGSPIPAGEIGTIVESDDRGIIAVKLDKHFDDLNQEAWWNNSMHMSINGADYGHALAMLILYCDPLEQGTPT